MRPVFCDAQAELVNRLETTTFGGVLNGKNGGASVN
jgi:hypothetical protein